jgi:hypothetical protein
VPTLQNIAANEIAFYSSSQSPSCKPNYSLLIINY